MKDLGLWYSFTATLILVKLYSWLTDRKPHPPLSNYRNTAAAELRIEVYLPSCEWSFSLLYQSI